MTSRRLHSSFTLTVVLSLVVCSHRAVAQDGGADAAPPSAPTSRSSIPGEQMIAALNLLPENPAAVVVVPKVSRLSGELGRLSTLLALPGGMLADVAAELKRYMMINNGFDDDGPLLFVVQQPPLPGAWPRAVMLIPVTDHGVMVANFGGEADGLTGLRTAHGFTGFAKALDRHTVIAQDRDMVQAYAPANAGAAILEQLGEDAEAMLTDHDLVAMIDVATFRQVLSPQIDRLVESISTMLEDEKEKVRPPGLPYLGWMLKTGIRDGQKLLVGANVDESKTDLAVALKFREGTPLAQVWSTSNESIARGMRSLPDRPYLFATGASFDGLKLGAMFDAQLAKLPDPDDQGWRPMMTLFKPIVENTKSASFAYLAPAANLFIGGSPINAVMVLETDNPEALVEHIKTMITTLGEINLFVPRKGAEEARRAEDAFHKVTFRPIYRVNANLLPNGKEVDLYNVSIAVPQMLMQEWPFWLRQGLLVTGATSLSGFVGIERGSVVVSVSPDLVLMQQAITAVAQRQGLGSNPVVELARDQHMPADPAIEAYAGLEGTVGVVNMFLDMFGAPKKLSSQTPPPASMGVSIKESTLVGQITVPTETMLRIQETWTEWVNRNTPQR